jgi:hypothetical protein
MTANLCPHCQKELTTIYGIINQTAAGLKKCLYLRKCPFCDNRFLHINSYTGTGNCTEYYLTLLHEDAAMLTRAFYQCPSPMSRSCTCPAHAMAEAFLETPQATEV